MIEFTKILIGALLYLLPLLNVSQASKIRGIDVDKFLKKIMASQNFDEIADRIADKAVKKITEMKDIKLKETDKKLQKVEPVYRVASSEISNNNTSDVQNMKTDVSQQTTTVKDKVIKYTISEIGSGLNKKEIIPIDGLALKFKHFTKNRVNTTQEEKRMKIHPIMQDISHQEGKEGEKISNLQYNEQSEETAENDKQPSSMERNVNETVEKQDEEEKSQDVVFKSRDSKVEESKAQAESAEDSLNADFEENYKAFVEYQNQKKTQKIITPSPIDVQDSPSLEDEIDDENESSFEEETTVVTSTKRDKSKKSVNYSHRHMHKEGNKIYTYVSSPDYQEYHEKLELARKKNAKVSY